MDTAPLCRPRCTGDGKNAASPFEIKNASAMGTRQFVSSWEVAFPLRDRSDDFWNTFGDRDQRGWFPDSRGMIFFRIHTEPQAL